MTTTETPPLLGSLEAARRIGVARTTLLMWVRLGEAFPAQKMAGDTGSFLWTEAEVERLREKREAVA